MKKSFPNNLFHQLTVIAVRASAWLEPEVLMVHFFLKLKGKKKILVLFTSLAFPTKGERANNIPVSSDLPSEQKYQKG